MLTHKEKVEQISNLNIWIRREWINSFNDRPPIIVRFYLSDNIALVNFFLLMTKLEWRRGQDLNIRSSIEDILSDSSIDENIRLKIIQNLNLFV